MDAVSESEYHQGNYPRRRCVVTIAANRQRQNEKAPAISAKAVLELRAPLKRPRAVTSFSSWQLSSPFSSLPWVLPPFQIWTP